MRNGRDNGAVAGFAVDVQDLEDARILKDHAGNPRVVTARKKLAT